MEDMGISRIEINSNNELLVSPKSNINKVFRFVYRADTGIEWSEESQTLYSLQPQGKSHFDLYKKILAAASSELGILLKPTNETLWVNVPEALKVSIDNYVYQ